MLTLFKRTVATLCVFTLCLMGSLSFFPKSFAESYSSTIVISNGSLPSGDTFPYQYAVQYFYGSHQYVLILCSDNTLWFRPVSSEYSGNAFSFRSTPASRSYTYFVFEVQNGSIDLTSPYSSATGSGVRTQRIVEGTGPPYFFDISGNATIYNNQSVGGSFTFSSPSFSSSPKFFDFTPFYFPELPYGFFDGNVTGSYGGWTTTLDFGTLTGTSSGSISYSESGSGSGTYSGSSSSSGGTISGGTYSGSGSLSLDSGEIGWTSGDLYDRTGQGLDTYEGEIYLNNGVGGSVSTSGTFTGTVTGGSGSESGTLTISSLSESGSGSFTVGQTFSGTVPANFTWVRSYADNARFRTWAVVSGSSYCYFLADTRNRITGSLENVSSSGGRLRFQAVGDDNVHYPFYCIEFHCDGTKIQTLSALANGFTVDFAPGILSFDDDTGRYSVDPLYHGFWLSDQCPSVNLSSLLNDEELKWLANPVFGESAFVLNFLDSLNSSVSHISDTLDALGPSIAQSLSNQTSAFQNMTADPATQPSTSQMSNYFMQESAFNAPNTDSMFSSGLSNAPMWSGVTWWSTKFNDLFIANNTLVAFFTTMLTLGLAVFIIGRRVNTK